MSTSDDNSYMITGKVSPPKIPVKKIASDGRNLPLSLLESVFNETSVQMRQVNNSSSLCALSFQASVWLSTDGLSTSSVGGLPYFLCNFCDYHTDSKAKLLEHVVCRHVFKCKLCDFVSLSLYELVQHQLHKHLDAEEMQPVLNAKMVFMNASLLQRNLHIFSQCDSLSHSARPSCGRPSESEVANSSVLNMSKVCLNVEANDPTQIVSGQSEHLYVKCESPVTSSKDKTCITAAEHNDTFSKPDWSILDGCSKTGGSSKRGNSHGGLTDCGPSSKRFRETFSRLSEAPDDLVSQTQSQSHQMPHFLDDSDSYVTSSCSPHKNVSPGILEIREEEQTNVSRNQGQAHEAYSTDQVLSFFMEPVSSALPKDLTESHIQNNENSTSEFGLLHKTESLYDDCYYDCGSEDPDAHLLRMTRNSPEDSRVDPPVLSNILQEGEKRNDDSSVLSKILRKSDSQETKKSQHLDLSMVSEEEFQVQLGKENASQNPSGPLLEACSDMLKILHDRSQLLQPKSLILGNMSEQSNSKPPNVNEKIRRWSHSQDINSEDVENFLIIPEDRTATEKVKETHSLFEDIEDNSAKHSVKEHGKTQISVNEKASYDLLRRLLDPSSGKDLMDALKANPEKKQTEILVSKDVSTYHDTQNSEENSGFPSHVQLVTRASDMSLRDLLTQGLEKISQPLFLECSYCNFKPSSKAEIQNHMNVCKFKDTQNKTKAVVRVLSKPDCEASMAEAELLSVKSQSLDGAYSSEKFVASELLKGLSEHYSERLSNDVSDRLCNDYSGKMNSDISVPDKSHKLQSECHLYGCDKSKASQSENKSSAPKSSNQIYSCDKLLALKNDRQIYSNDRSHSLKRDSQIDSHDMSHTLKTSAQINESCFARDHNEGLGRKMFNSNKSEIKNSKHFSKKSELVQEYLWDGSSQTRDEFSCKNKQDLLGHVTKEEDVQICIPSKRKHDLSVEEFHCCDKNNFVIEKQQEIRYKCMYCDYSTNGVINVQDHLFGHHPTNVSFVKAYIPPKGNTLLYFCRGVQSTCAFVSSENVEIFEHIKLCYNGYLDNFMNSDKDSSPDYSQVLLGLGKVSECINASEVMFYCLRCSFYAIDFQLIADHISNKHPNLVAGVLSVNRHFNEPRIRMVCLVCKSHINVKQWASHPCRKCLESNFNSRSATKLETILRLSSLPRGQSLSFASGSAVESHSLSASSEDTIVSDQEDCKPQVKVNHLDLCTHELVNENNCLTDLSRPDKEDNYANGANIKQEMPDLTLEEYDDVSVHCTQRKRLEMKTDGADYSGNESSRISQKVQSITPPHSCSRKLAPGSSVLHSLLTATGTAQLGQQKFSSLHALLQADVAAEGRRPPNPAPGQQTELMSTANLHSQYPCIHKILSRQEFASQEAACTENNMPHSPATTALLKDESRGFVARQPSSAVLSALSHPHVLSPQISKAAATTKCLPELHVSLSNQSSDELLPLPVTSTVTAESSDKTGPFTNLLQLLCKSKHSDA